jgi:hypothetical protein
MFSQSKAKASRSDRILTYFLLASARYPAHPASFSFVQVRMAVLYVSLDSLLARSSSDWSSVVEPKGGTLAV